jgi:hypothetical protein
MTPFRSRRTIKRGLILMLALFTGPVSRAGILEARTDDLERANAEAAKSKGGPEHNQLTLVESPRRGGAHAFKHWVDKKGERSELSLRKTDIGGTYWYGWSMLLPEDFDCSGSPTIVMQLATWPTKRNGKFPCKANGSFIHIAPDGKLLLHLQRQGDDTDMVCDKHLLLDDVRPLRGQWLDFVMHAKWTGEPDGFLHFWVKPARAAEWQQKIAWKGRTFWNDEDRGPYFKMGLYTGDPGWKGPPHRTLYTDEYRLGDANATFEDVAPRGAPAAPAKP